MTAAPSLYLSLFNDRALKRSTDPRSLYPGVERRIKYLLLTKGTFFLPVAHILDSSLASHFIKRHVSLIDKGLIVPAIRDTAPTIDEMIDQDARLMHQPRDAEVVALLRDRAARIRTFSVTQTEGLVRQRLAADLAAPDGLLVRWLGEEIPSVRELVATASIGHLSYQLRAHGTNLRRSLSAARVRLLRAYYDVLYYVAGANDFRSECYIPQANVPSMLELVAGADSVADDALFRDLLLPVIARVTGIEISRYFLDHVSIDDIVAFRESSLSFSSFCGELRRLHTVALGPKSLASPQDLVFELAELARMRRDLEVTYEQRLRKELRVERHIGVGAKVTNLVIAAGSLALAPLGLLTGLADIAGSALNLSPLSDRAERALLRMRARLTGKRLIAFADELFAFQAKTLPKLLDARTS
jgi:hypothetical protein